MHRLSGRILIVLTVLASCSQPTSHQGGSGFDLTKPASVIKSLKVGSVSLPKSLQDGSTNTSARNIGDVTDLTSLNLPSLKASGWYDLREQLGDGGFVTMFLDALKTSPAVTSGSLAPGQVVDTGTVMFDQSEGSALALPHSGRLTTSLSPDGSTLRMYWSLLFPGPNATGNSQQDVYSNGPRINLFLYFLVQKSGAAELWIYLPHNEEGQYMKLYAKADSANQTSIVAQDMVWVAGQRAVGSQVVVPQGGAVALYRGITMGDCVYEGVGYADDSFGGLASAGVDEWDGESYNYLDVEYYDGTGNLVYRGWGDSDQNANQWSWRFDETTNYNLYELNHAKPNQLSSRTTWHSSDGSSTYEVSFDNGASWVPADSGIANGSVVYHDASGDSGSWNLKPGDAVYWVDRSDSVQQGSDWVYTQTYYQGYEIPTGETYFGNTYFVTKEYPLKNLLPLRAAYVSDYEVRQREGNSYYSYADKSGKWRYTPDAPNAGSYDPDTLFHWTDYTYWLENKGYLNTSGINDNSAGAYDPSKGDVSVQLDQMEVWYWDNVHKRTVSMKAPTFSTSSQDLPPYFGLAQSQITGVAAMKTKLESLYATRSQFAASNYLTDYQTTIDAALPQFPSLVGYPGYTP